MTQPSGTDQDDLSVDPAAQADGAAESTKLDGTRPPEQRDTEVVDSTAEVSAKGSPAIETLTTAVESLREALATSLRAQEHQHRLLDKIHDEKERLREAEQRRQRDPILRDLIQLSDMCVRTSRQWKVRRDVSVETTEKVSAVLLEVAADVALILERQGLEEFAPLPEDKFIRGEAKAIAARPTADAALDGVICEIRKPGYRLGERVLRFSEVVVWRLEHSSDSTGGSAPR